MYAPRRWALKKRPLHFGESLSCLSAFPRWTVWFTSILAAVGENGAQRMGGIWTTASRDQIIRLVIGNLLLGLVSFLAKAKAVHPDVRQCPRIAGTANLSAREPR